MNRGYEWTFSPENIKPSRKLISDIESRFALIIDRFKRDFIREPKEGNESSYIVDIYQKKRGRFFYLCAKYRCPAKNCISEFFDIKFARLECYISNTFNLAYMRHNDEWNDPYRELTLDECMKMIETDELFHP